MERWNRHGDVFIGRPAKVMRVAVFAWRAVFVLVLDRAASLWRSRRVDDALRFVEIRLSAVAIVPYALSV